LNALPSTCSGAMSSAGPYVPVTTVTANGYGVFFQQYMQTSVDYYSPGLGVVCSNLNYQSVFSDFSRGALSSLPLQLPFYRNTNAFTLTTVLTAVAAPGSIGIASRARKTFGEQATRIDPRLPFRPHRLVSGGNF
jgi:hypothetical protein